jgi:hypothetical protein
VLRGVRRVAAAALAALLLPGCSGNGGATVGPTASPSISPSAPPSSTPETEFALEVDELFALVEDSVRGSGDLAASSQVLHAFATTVALIRVPEEQTSDRQRVVEAAEAAAEAYFTASRITGAIERSATVDFAERQLQQLETVIAGLPR